MTNEEVERKARELCCWCGAGLPLIKGDPDKSEYPYGHGVDSGDGILTAVECDVADIRALQDSLDSVSA